MPITVLIPTIGWAWPALAPIVGGVAAWLRQGKWRRTARKLEGEVRALQAEIDIMNARETYRGQPQLPAETAATPAISPPAP